jgi:hypothetical protein
MRSIPLSVSLEISMEFFCRGLATTRMQLAKCVQFLSVSSCCSSSYSYPATNSVSSTTQLYLSSRKGSCKRLDTGAVAFQVPVRERVSKISSIFPSSTDGALRRRTDPAVSAAGEKSIQRKWTSSTGTRPSVDTDLSARRSVPCPSSYLHFSCFLELLFSSVAEILLHTLARRW